MKNRIELFSMLITVIILAACGAKPISTPASPGALPNSLVTIEAAAEDIIDFAPSGDWEKINKDVTDISNAWKAYQPRAGKDGPPRKFRMR